METLNLRAIKIFQNHRKFYFFKIKASDLKEIAYYNPRAADMKEGIQRIHDVKRSKDIALYIDSEDSVLANNIIINFTYPDLISYDDKSHTLSIKLKKESAFVVDGQHRLKAFDYTENTDFQLPVSAFVELSLAEIAELFVKINYYQRPVNKSLVYDLLGISKDIFPAFFEAHRVTILLHETIGSPFFGLIKLLGVGTGIVTQAGIITALDKNKILNEVLKDFTTEQKAKILSNYFEAIKIILPYQWGNKKYILTKSVGINAFISIFPRIFNKIYNETNGFKIEEIAERLKWLKKFNFDAEEISGLVGMKGVKILTDKLEINL